jgi:hypothetical protein
MNRLTACAVALIADFSLFYDVFLLLFIDTKGLRFEIEGLLMPFWKGAVGPCGTFVPLRQRPTKQLVL